MKKFIDVFSGVGGFRIGLQEAGAVCVFSSEINKRARKVYERNFGDIPSGDITKISSDIIPDHDILVGGWPCQSFSGCGKRLGLVDDRGRLIYELARILRDKQPRAAILENVARLVTAKDGEIMREVTSLLDACGYDVHSQVINSKAWVPQARKRVYLVLFRKDLGITSFEFPSSPSVKPLYNTPRDLLQEKVDDKRWLTPEQIYTIAKKHDRRLPRIKWFSYQHGSADGVLNTIIASNAEANLILPGKPFQVRTLTEREQARAMGFPESFKHDESYRQASQQFGNSVVVPLIRDIAIAVMRALEK